MDNEMVRAVKLRELDHMVEHIPAEVLTLRIVDLAIEGAGLETFDVMDLYAKVESHASAVRVALPNRTREATDEELEAFVERAEVVQPPADSRPPDDETEEPEVEPAEKTCKECGESKPVSEFFRNRHGVTGLCSACMSEKQKRGQKRAREEKSGENAEEEKPSAPVERTKTCTKCGETKPLSEYRGHNKTPDGKMGVCRSCATPFNNSKPTAKKTAEPPRDTNGEGDEGNFENALDYVADLRSNPRVNPEPKRVDYCVNGEDCVAFERIGRPTKLAQDNTSGECGACVQADQQRVRRGEKKRLVKEKT